MYSLMAVTVLQLTAFTEIGIMQRLQHIPGVCKLHDYGITEEGIHLVMTKYHCSLRQWRERQGRTPSQQLKLYLNIFWQLVEVVQVDIVIKSQNIQILSSTCRSAYVSYEVIIRISTYSIQPLNMWPVASDGQVSRQNTHMTHAFGTQVGPITPVSF